MRLCARDKRPIEDRRGWTLTGPPYNALGTPSTWEFCSLGCLIVFGIAADGDLPCPFCGGPLGDESWHRCQRCGAGIDLDAYRAQLSAGPVPVLVREPMSGERVRGKHRSMVWVDGHDRIRISEQYAGRPADGVVFIVEQRTTLAGRSVLLSLDDVREIRDFLSSLISASAGASPASRASHGGDVDG
jgi:hypothetical protein